MSGLVVLSKFSLTPDIHGLDLFVPVVAEEDVAVEPDDRTLPCPSGNNSGWFEAIVASMDATAKSPIAKLS